MKGWDWFGRWPRRQCIVLALYIKTNRRPRLHEKRWTIRLRIHVCVSRAKSNLHSGKNNVLIATALPGSAYARHVHSLRVGLL